MARNLHTDLITEITANQLVPIILMNAVFDSGNIRLWVGTGDLVYDGNTYLGAGDILAISPVSEETDTVSSGLTVTLSGLNASILTLANTEPYQGRSLELYIAALDESTGSIAGSAYMIFEGAMDVMTVEDTGDSITISMNVENILASLQRPLNTKWTSEDQKREFPNDTGFDFVNDIQNKEVIWG